jgi:hypothetical protein
VTRLLRTGSTFSYSYKNASTSGEQFPTTPLESFGVTQNISLNRVNSTAQIFLHTITGAAGGGNIVLNLVASTAQVFLPAVSVNIALNQTPSVAQVFLPTITVPTANNIVLNRVNSVNNIYLLSLAGETVAQDTSDILDKGLKRKNVLTAKEEEEIAAQLLKARQKTKKRKEEVKKLVDWKKLFLDKINGVTTEEELNAIEISTETVEVTAAVLAEIEKQKELKRIQLETLRQEAAVKALELKAALDQQESAISAKLEEQRKQLEEAKGLQAKILERYKIAQEAAVEEERRVAYEASMAEKAYLEFKQKRDNRIKRLKALMWLTKLDL